VTTGARRLPSEVCAGFPFPLRGQRPWCQSIQVARQAASLSVAARCPLQHPSCHHRRRCWLHGPEQSVSRNVLPNRWTALYLLHLRRAGNRAGPILVRCRTFLRSSIRSCPLPGNSPREPSSLGIVGCPSSDVPCCVHSTRADARDRTVAWWPRFSFRPCGISPLRRFAPQHGFRACCIPVPDMGFAGFQKSPSSSTEVDSDEVCLPASAPPSEGFLLVGSRSPSLGSAPS
jgi:hypothetical protein